MLLTKRMEEKVRFANFCKNEGLDPFDVAQLCQLVQRRATAAMNDVNVRHDQKSQEKADAKDEKLIAQIKEMGKTMGLEIEFPSCYPSVTKNGKNINLPLN
jgi:hypothetical protein